MEINDCAGEKEPVLSVILPTYGVEKYLQACLESILKVDLLLEVVVVIDASPDNSLAIARQFEKKDPRVKIIENEKNQGLGASRNIGFKESRGKFVLFADSDDLVVPEALEAMIRSLEDSGSDFATSPADEFGKTKSRMRYWTTQAQIFREGVKNTNLEKHPELIADHTAWTKIFRASFVQSESIYWAERVKCEDVYASTKAYVTAKSIDVVPQVSYLYRRRPGSITTNLTSSNTLGDWARQTSMALKLVDDKFVAKQRMISKILEVEVPSRLDTPFSTLEPEDLTSFESCIADILEKADKATLCDVRLFTLQKLSGQPWADLRVVNQVKRIQELSTETEPAAFEKQLDKDSSVKLTQIKSEINSPLLSIVMPTFNVSYWIDEAIKSVLDQELDDIELIIVDDKSTDDTWERIQLWAQRDFRIQAVKNPGDGGAQARNFGVTLARGQFLTFADGDDLIPQKAYRRMVSSMQKSGSDMAVGDFQKFWPSSVWRNTEEFGLHKKKTGTRLALDPKLIVNRTCWNRIFKLDFWKNNSLHFPSTPRANDILPMTLAMHSAKSIDVIPHVVYHYRARSGNGSMTSRVATSESLIGYFRQEFLCAMIIESGSGKELRDAYWKTALHVDGWGNLSNYLKQGQEAGEFKSQKGVSNAVGQLLDASPHEIRVTLGPIKTLIYQLVSESKMDEAVQLWEIDRRRQMNRASSLVVIRCLLAIEEKSKFKDEILRVYQGAVLRPLVDDSSEWITENAEEIVELSKVLSSEINLREAPTPETKEERVLEAVLLGNESLVRQECRGRLPRADIRLMVSAHAEDEVTLKIEGTDSNVAFLEIVKRPRVGDSNLTIPLFPSGSNAVIDSDLFYTLRGAGWKVRGVLEDELGSKRVPVGHIEGKNASRMSSVRVSPNEIQILLQGSDRLRQAVNWRMKKLQRTMRKEYKK